MLYDLRSAWGLSCKIKPKCAPIQKFYHIIWHIKNLILYFLVNSLFLNSSLTKTFCFLLFYKVLFYLKFYNSVNKIGNDLNCKIISHTEVFQNQKYWNSTHLENAINFVLFQQQINVVSQLYLSWSIFYFIFVLWLKAWNILNVLNMI